VRAAGTFVTTHMRFSSAAKATAALVHLLRTREVTGTRVLLDYAAPATVASSVLFFRLGNFNANRDALTTSLCAYSRAAGERPPALRLSA
jgi:hypothetical protein